MCLLLAAALTVSAGALEVPASTAVQNLNGSQQAVKTYTAAPEADTQGLIEEPFQLEGWPYTYADIVKEENTVDERQSHTVGQQIEAGGNGTKKREEKAVRNSTNKNAARNRKRDGKMRAKFLIYE